MLYREEENGAHMYAAQPCEADESQFVSGIENLYNISLNKFYSIPETNRTEYLTDCFSLLYNYILNPRYYQRYIMLAVRSLYL